MRVIPLLIALTLSVSAAIEVPAHPPSTPYSLANNAFGTLEFQYPLCITSPPGNTHQLYVGEKTGRIMLIPDVTAPQPVSTVFLDLPAALSARNERVQQTGESGLTSLAFHPEYETNPTKRFVFVFYIASRKFGPGYLRLSRFTTFADQPNIANPASEVILFNQSTRTTTHHGGDLHFGPDGYLYVSLGDGGGQGDPYHNSQRIDRNLFSGILRIDVDKKPGNLEPPRHSAIPRINGLAHYSIPIDNPYVHTSLGGSWNGLFNGKTLKPSKVRSEFWAVGLRNPWRMSFDPQTHELLAGDVGGVNREEINLITRGGNYGWAYREGESQRPGSRPAPAGLTFDEPLHRYAHGTGPARGNCVIGGVVYRGTSIPALQGAYLFGDYINGHIWALRRTPEPSIERLAGSVGTTAFGRDPSNGDVLIVNIQQNVIQRLVANPPVPYPQTLSATGLFSDTLSLTPDPQLHPYAVNLPFWSDHAIKQRWAYLPPGSSMMWSRDGLWSFPAGMIWVKHFDLETTRNVPSTRKRLETRVLVKNTSGVYGVSYRWNESGTEATLVPDEGDEFPQAINDGGTLRTQQWIIPSRSQCLQCHNPQAGYALSFNTRQLNCEGGMFGGSGNQLSALDQQGWFSNSIEAPNTLPRHVRANEGEFTLEARVRSYLAVNCSQCHRPEGGALPAFWDARAEIPLAAMHLINEVPADKGNSNANRLVAPGYPSRSVLLSHMRASNGFSRMPPLGSTEVDTASADLVAAWILQKPSIAPLSSAPLAAAPAASPSATALADPQIMEAPQAIPLMTPAFNAAAMPTLALTRGQASAHCLRVTLPDDQAFQIEVSNDLQRWTPLDVPGNHGIQRPAGTIEWTLPVNKHQQQFYRTRVWEQ